LLYFVLLFFNNGFHVVEGSTWCICGISSQNEIQKHYATWSAKRGSMQGLEKKVSLHKHQAWEGLEKNL